MRSLFWGRTVLEPGVTVPESQYSRAVAFAETIDFGEDVLEELGKRSPPAKGTNGSASSRQQSDPIWESIPIGGVDIRRFLLTSAVSVTVGHLARHQSLNPRDVYLDKRQLAELDGLLAPLKAELYRIHSEQARVVQLEFSEMIQRGGAASVLSPGSNLDLSMLPAAASEKYNLFRRVSDRIYMADTETMPGAQLLATAMAAKGQVLAVAVASWFYSQGTLSQGELNKLVDSFQDGNVSWNANRDH